MRVNCDKYKNILLLKMIEINRGFVYGYESF